MSSVYFFVTFLTMLSVDDKMIRNNKLERMRNEVVVAQFEVLTQLLFGETEENHRRLQSG